MTRKLDPQAKRRSGPELGTTRSRRGGDGNFGADRSAAGQVLSLQRAAGNHVVSRMLAELGRETPGPRPAASQRLLPANDRRAESEADAVADRASANAASTKRGRDRSRDRQAGTTSSRPGKIPAALESALGEELPRASLEPVRFDTSVRAGAEADSIGALAFSEAHRVAFAPGELDLSTRDGFHLAAHETAHAALHRASPGRSVTGGRLVHAKLRGLRAAAEQGGGGKTTKGVRKKLGATTNWDQILDGLGAYEGLEEKLLAGGPPSSTVLAKARPKLLSTLAKLESSMLSWQKSNDAESTAGIVEKAEKKRSKADKLATSDTRSKSARRQTISMLLARVRTELADLQSGRWDSTLGLSDAQLESKGREDQGGVNKVQELTYATESGPYSGFFKEDVGFAKRPEGHEGDVGISQFDPNYGNRALAMHRLDQVLGAGVTARVEYAVHEGKMGTVMESAKGTRGADAQFVHTDAGKSESKGAISLEDATLQRCLNKLQILDAIAGQLDRHAGNYFIQQDKTGKVSGVTGIDLDMAFGAKMKTPDAREAALAHNYKGMPKEIDEQFGRRILAISSKDIEGALSGLLPAGEVRATVSRFEWVKDKINEAERQGLLRQNWDAESQKSTLPQKQADLSFATKRNTYLADLAGSGSEQLQTRIQDDARRAIDNVFRGVPEVTMALYKRLIAPTNNATGLAPLVARAVYSRELKEDKVLTVVDDVIDTLEGENDWRNKIELFAQENENPTLQHNEFATDKVIDAAFQRAVKKYGLVRAG